MLLNIKFILFLTHLCIVCMGSVIYSRPGYSYHSELNGWLKLHLEPVTWRDARISCHMEGAFLASAWTAEFTKSVHELQSSDEQSSENALPALYSGFHTTTAEGAFTFVNGKPTITLDHDKMAALERCGAFFENGTSGEVSCDTLLPYVCYAPATASTPVPDFNTTATLDPVCTTSAPVSTPAPVHEYKCDVYEFESKTGSWYKFHTTAAAHWNDAKRACEEEGAYLVIINSEVEAQVLLALLQTCKPKLSNVKYDMLMYIGIEAHGSEPSSWRTIHGQTLEEAGYNKWKSGFPYSIYSIPYYGYLGWDGELRNLVEYKVPFICEK